MRSLTSWLDLAGSLLIVVAVAVLLWPWTPAGALGSAGAGLLLLSWIVSRPPRRPRPPRVRRQKKPRKARTP